MKTSLDHAAALHRRAVATADAASAALDLFVPSVPPPHLIAAQRALAARLADEALVAAPGWLGTTLDGTVTEATGSHGGAFAAVRIGSATPLPDAPFPVVVPLLGAGHLVVEGARHNLRTTALLRSVLLRLIAAVPAGSLRVRAADPTGIAFAPFQPLFEGNVMPAPATDLSGLRAVLGEAEQWIRVPAPPGRTLLIVIAGRPDGTDTADLARLEALAEAGPAARVHLLIGDWPSGERTLAHSIRVRFHGGATLVDGFNAPVVLDRDPSTTLIDEVCRGVGERARVASPLRLTDLLPTETWQSDGADGLATIVGLTGHTPLTLRLNDRTPHWLVGGRSGAGRTALLVDVLYGLCSRYAPDELGLYLLDFTETGSFREFTPNERDGSWIPHTRAAGARPDRAYGLAVLRELGAELARRSELFRTAAVSRFADLRATVRLPRVVCVIDEFPVLLGGDDRVAREAVALLDDVARTGRAYGMHLILAGRTLRGDARWTARDSMFGQFPVRIALPGGGDVLDVRNSAAESLRLGTAIVNTAGGLGGPSGAMRAHERLVEFPDPNLEPKVLAALRRGLWLARPAAIGEWSPVPAQALPHGRGASRAGVQPGMGR